MTVKHALEQLKYTDREIESFEDMKHQTIALYESVDYESDTLQQMIDYTDKRIEEEQSHYEYWHKLITEIADDRYRNILTMRYLEDRTVEEVAEELYYTVSHTFRLTNQAAKVLEQAHRKAYKG